jgi:hypothetical protein
VISAVGVIARLSHLKHHAPSICFLEARKSLLSLAALLVGASSTTGPRFQPICRWPERLHIPRLSGTWKELKACFDP